MDWYLLIFEQSLASLSNVVFVIRLRWSGIYALLLPVSLGHKTFYYQAIVVTRLATIGKYHLDWCSTSGGQLRVRALIDWYSQVLDQSQVSWLNVVFVIRLRWSGIYALLLPVSLGHKTFYYQAIVVTRLATIGKYHLDWCSTSGGQLRVRALIDWYSQVLDQSQVSWLNVVFVIRLRWSGIYALLLPVSLGHKTFYYQAIVVTFDWSRLVSIVCPLIFVSPLM